MGTEDEELHHKATSSTAPQPDAPESCQEVLIKRLHILPLKEAERKIGSQGRMEVLADTLRQIRNDKQVVRSGDILRAKNADFVIIKSDPSQGCLGMETDFFLEGSPLPCFTKVQFSAWGQTQMTPETLFRQYIKPFFKRDYLPYGSKNAQRVRLVHTGQVIKARNDKAGEVYLQVEATDPPGLGVVSTDTEIFALWDTTPEFEKVQILPFQDTLPRAYEYELFSDYLKPYLLRNGHRKYQMGDFFTYQGVQFKIVACEPEGLAARIGKSSTIFCEGQLNPTLRNLLPPDLMHQVAQLPQGLQLLLLSSERTAREVEELMNQRRGLSQQIIEDIERFDWPPPDAASQLTCMVCLEDFELAASCRRLPCHHVFHQHCIDLWLMRCTDCPICKANVDRGREE